MDGDTKNSQLKTVVLTGSTGSFGKFLAREFLKHQDVKLLLPVRAASEEEAGKRVEEIIREGHDRVEAFQADLTQNQFGLSDAQYEELLLQTTRILHSAASTRFNLPLEEARLHNVTMTEHILEFAKDCPGLARFGFVSTALVSGRRTGVIKEDEFEHNEGFNNSYQQTKYEAEKLVRNFSKEHPTVVFRPPLIVSAANNNADAKSLDNFLPLLLGLVVRGLLPFIPGTPDSKMDLVYPEDAAKAIVAIFLKNSPAHLVYHITNGSKAFTIGEMLELLEKKIDRRLSLEFFGTDTEACFKRVEEMGRERPEIVVAYKRSQTFLVEPAYSKIFDNRNTLSELGIEQVGADPIKIYQSILKDLSWDFSA